ncbi:MAG: aminopeptidase P family protein [Lentisphaeria bacterium]|nr:aminopeptidase P family protein [Lentisphaeria bacterium]
MPDGRNIGCGKLICASSAESSDILYASGFNAADEFLYFELNGKRTAVVSPLEFQRARSEVHEDVGVMDSTDIAREFPREERQQPLALLVSRKCGVTRWLVPGSFPLGLAEKLRAAGVETVPVSDDFFPERAVKTEREIGFIRESMAATEEAMHQVESFLRESKIRTDGMLELNGQILLCEWIRSEVEAEFKRKGFSASRTIIACGPDASAPHCIGSGPVRAGEPLVADIFPRSDRTGYWGDMTRTFVKGKASPVVLRAFQAVKNASEEVLKVLKPGRPGSDYHALAAKVLESAGFRTVRGADGIPRGFFHGLGHGVGLDIHENPRLSPSGSTILEPGHVVSVEPGLYDPAWGGIRLEDLVVIRADGCENFCTMPKELEIP